MKNLGNLLIFIFLSLNLHAATEFAQLEQALKQGDFATVQKLVPAKFDILKTEINGKNLKAYAVTLRKLHDYANAYDQIAYYLGAENKNISTPLIVFVKTHVKKLGIACLTALGLYVAKKQLEKDNKTQKKEAKKKNIAFNDQPAITEVEYTKIKGIAYKDGAQNEKTLYALDEEHGDVILNRKGKHHCEPMPLKNAKAYSSTDKPIKSILKRSN